MKKQRVAIENNEVKWFIYEYHLALTLVAFLGIAVFILFFSKDRDWKVLLTVVGSLLSFVYFIQTQHLNEAKFANELFVQFNARYDTMNERLNSIRKGSSTESLPFARHEVQTLFDYFNLCAEEYLFYRRGYIYPEVWKFWVAGMKPFYDDKRIKRLWDKELKTGSYYGLDMAKETDPKTTTNH